MQAGKNKHEHICESLELFGKAVMPEFASRRDEQERIKAERLAPVIERALARRSPARQAPPAYLIDEDAEVERARRSRRSVSLKPRAIVRDGIREARTQIRRRGSKGLARWARGKTDHQIEKRFSSKVVQRGLYTAMAASFNPKMAFGFEGEVQHELRFPATGGETAVWTIEVDREQSHRAKGPGPLPRRYPPDRGRIARAARVRREPRRRADGRRARREGRYRGRDAAPGDVRRF